MLAHLASVDWGVPVRCVEFDSIGVPDGADTAWRHGAIEHWVGARWLRGRLADL